MSGQQNRSIVFSRTTILYFLHLAIIVYTFPTLLTRSKLLKQVPAACQQLMDNVENTMRHALEEEEKIDMDTVTNFAEVRM